MTVIDERAAVSIVSVWNKNWPVGTAVFAVKNDGTIEKTKTSSEAHVIKSGRIAIALEGSFGLWALERIIPLKRQGAKNNG